MNKTIKTKHKQNNTATATLDEVRKMTKKFNKKYRKAFQKLAK